MDTGKAHGAALGDDEVAAVKRRSSASIRTRRSRSARTSHPHPRAGGPRQTGPRTMAARIRCLGAA
ncbi:hypothetical protein ABLN97_11585 [Mycobacterium tuberculosis]